MNRIVPAAAARSRSVMVAVVIGAACAAPAQAGPADVSPQSVQAISRYCQTCWRNARLPADRWPDCTQEVLARLLETVEPVKWPHLLRDDGSDERREFIRAIDAVKKRTQRARKFAALTPDVPDLRNRPVASVRDDREALAKAAREVLSPRQRRILELTADGWAVPEIATELETTVERVSDEKYKAVRKLRHHFGNA